MENTRISNIEEFIGEIEKASKIPSTHKGKELNRKFHKVLITKTNHHGDIEYANEAFLKATGYKAHELINKPHNIVKHPDIPLTIYECMKRSLIKTKKFGSFMKIKTKNEDYFWVEEHCELKDEDESPLIYMKRYFVNYQIIENEIIPLYKKLKKLEKFSIDNSIAYLVKYLSKFSATCYEEAIEYVKKQYNEQSNYNHL